MTNINTFQGDVFIHEYIKHTGDDNNLFGFSGTDTFKIATAGADALTVQANGNVGMGTATSDNRLHIYNNADNVGYVVENNARTFTMGIRGDTSDHFAITDDTAGEFRMQITPAGLVGIGGATPTQGLQVKGNNHASIGNWNDGTYEGNILVKDSGGGVGNGGGIMFGASQASHFCGIKAVITNGGGESIGRMYFYMRSDTSHSYMEPRMVMMDSGRIGLGTLDPVALFQVQYAEGVYADTDYSTSSTWHGKGIGIMGGTGGFIYGNDVNHSVWMRRSPKHTGADANSYINPSAHKFYTGALVGSSGLLLRANISNSGLQVTGAITATGSITPNSDDRIKYNEEDIPDALDTIGNLRPKKYEKIIDTIDKEGIWIPTDEEWENVRNDYTHINEFGLIAQDVRNIPELAFLVKGEEMTSISHTISQEMYSNLNTQEQTIYTKIYTHHYQSITQEEFSNLTPEGQEECMIEYIKYVNTQTPLSIDYNGIFVVAVKAIQELNTELQAEKVRNDALEARILALESA